VEGAKSRHRSISCKAQVLSGFHCLRNVVNSLTQLFKKCSDKIQRKILSYMN
jgi:hypothetical protein